MIERMKRWKGRLILFAVVLTAGAGFPWSERIPFHF